MKDWKRCKVQSDMTLMQVLRVINDSDMQMALVVDGSDRLLGIITDGDARRAILTERGTSVLAASIMNKSPIVFQKDQTKSFIIHQMQKLEIRHAPVIDLDGKGGLGTRLRPLTDDCPKPLLKVGNKPILETILESFMENGFRRFYFSVNYRSEMIENYFGDGSRYGVEICYIHEKERMGTAGALSLLSGKLTESAFVMNGDILTKMDFGEAIDYHEKHHATATMVVREMSYRIPYGVVQYQEDNITGIAEKPTHTFYVNAGMYVLSPEAVSHIEKKGFLDMPDLFTTLIENRFNVKVYPVVDYWMDIGKIDDFYKAQMDYANIFQ